jgi:hypothetical protein
MTYANYAHHSADYFMGVMADVTTDYLFMDLSLWLIIEYLSAYLKSLSADMMR